MDKENVSFASNLQGKTSLEIVNEPNQESVPENFGPYQTDEGRVEQGFAPIQSNKSEENLRFAPKSSMRGPEFPSRFNKMEQNTEFSPDDTNYQNLGLDLNKSSKETSFDPTGGHIERRNLYAPKEANTEQEKILFLPEQSRKESLLFAPNGDHLAPVTSSAPFVQPNIFVKSDFKISPESKIENMGCGTFFHHNPIFPFLLILAIALCNFEQNF